MKGNENIWHQTPAHHIFFDMRTRALYKGRDDKQSGALHVRLCKQQFMNAGGVVRYAYFNMPVATSEHAYACALYLILISIILLSLRLRIDESAREAETRMV